MRWKTAVIWMLAALNGLLLLGVVLSFAVPPAEAQVVGRGGYLLIPASYQTNDEAVWIIDQSSRVLGLYMIDSRGDLERVDRRSLEKDFRTR
jgi:hypothetical protein